MLVVTPAPVQHESLIGYVIRLTQVNGYESPGTILCYAGYGSASALGKSSDLRLLADILGRDVDELADIAYGNVRGAKWNSASYRGHEISHWRIARVLAPKETSVCPECIAEQGFIDSFWDLTLATACPKHGCKTLQVCPNCNKSINWLRPGLLECRCGALLGDVSTGNAETPELELLGLVQAKLEKRSLQDCQNNSQFPVAELNQMNFVQLATVIFLIGQHSKRLSHREALAQPNDVVQGAVQALSEWPKGFRTCLLKLGARNAENDCGLNRLRDQYGAFYRAISGEKELASAAMFLRREFDAFLEEEKFHEVLSGKRLNSKVNTYLRQSMTMDWICSRYGFSRKRLEGWCKAKRKDNAALSPQDLKRFVVEAEITGHLRIAKTRAITERQAAAMAGLPVTVLRGFRELGYIVSQSDDTLQWGYRSSEIEKLTEALQRVGKRISPMTIQTDWHVSLARLLETTTFWSRLGKSEFLVDVLERRIESYGRTGDALQQLYFDKARVDEHIDARKSAESRNGVTRGKAGTMLGCSSDCVNELVIQKYLATTPGPYYRNICRDSVLSFAADFVPLNDLAKRTKSTSHALRRKAKENGLELILINSKRGVTTSFIRRSEIEVLQEIVEKQQSDAAQRSEQWRNRSSSIDKLVKYLSSMHKAGKPLPRVGKRLNLRKIASASGMCRNLFYESREAHELLTNAECKDAAKHGIDSRTDLEILRSYLEDLKKGKVSIPIGRHGGPNKLQIARLAGVERNVFYNSPEAKRLFSQFRKLAATSCRPTHGGRSKHRTAAVSRVGGPGDD